MTSALRWGGGSAPRPGRFTPGKDPVPIVQGAGWAPGPVWKGAENLAPPPTGIRFPDRPACSESLYRLSYPGSYLVLKMVAKKKNNFSLFQIHKPNLTGSNGNFRMNCKPFIFHRYSCVQVHGSRAIFSIHVWEIQMTLQQSFNHPSTVTTEWHLLFYVHRPFIHPHILAGLTLCGLTFI